MTGGAVHPGSGQAAGAESAPPRHQRPGVRRRTGARMTNPPEGSQQGSDPGPEQAHPSPPAPHPPLPSYGHQPHPPLPSYGQRPSSGGPPASGSQPPIPQQQAQQPAPQQPQYGAPPPQ